MKNLVRRSLPPLFLVAASCLSPFSVTAAEPDETPMARRAETVESEIRTALESYQRAFNDSDAARVASFWSEKAVFMSPEGRGAAVGRNAIESEFKLLFQEQRIKKLSLEPDAIELVSSSVAIESGVAEIEFSDGEAATSHYQTVWIQVGDRWLIDRLSDEISNERLDRKQRLSPLGFLLGTWQQTDDGFSMNYAASQVEGDSFIRVTYRIAGDQSPEFSGTQMIAWDEAEKRFRSWSFDSDGNVAQGVWTESAGDWSIKSNVTTADGEKGSNLIVIHPIDGGYEWRKTNQVVDGEKLPDEPMLVVRPILVTSKQQD